MVGIVDRYAIHPDGTATCIECSIMYRGSAAERLYHQGADVANVYAHDEAHVVVYRSRPPLNRAERRKMDKYRQKAGLR